MGKYGLTDKYAYRKGTTGSWTEFGSIAGVRVLSIDGIDERGDAVNVYSEQWVNSETEDFLIADDENKIIRKNVDINLTLIVSRRYTISEDIDEQQVYDSIISTLCETGDLYLRSYYVNKIVHVVCLKSFKPTAVKLHRGRNSYILATIPFHVLEPPETIS